MRIRANGNEYDGLSPTHDHSLLTKLNLASKAASSSKPVFNTPTKTITLDDIDTELCSINIIQDINENPDKLNIKQNYRKSIRVKQGIRGLLTQHTQNLGVIHEDIDIGIGF